MSTATPVRTSEPKTLPLPPINLMRWVHEHRDQLKPPVGNKYLYRGEDFFVMIIAGPNARNDFHITRSEEFFYQIQGDVSVLTREGGRTVEHRIREGEVFFIPPNVPHAPQRGPNTLGLVVERERPPGEREHLVWFCPKCDALVYDLEFDCKDIVDHFRDMMEAFWGDDAKRTCGKCGTKIERPGPCTR